MLLEQRINGACWRVSQAFAQDRQMLKLPLLLKITGYIPANMKRKKMDWLQFLQIVCVPAFVWLVYKFGEMRKELNEFKVQVAREYATQVHINRLELKIDELREMIWELHNESAVTKRHKKQ